MRENYYDKIKMVDDILIENDWEKNIFSNVFHAENLKDIYKEILKINPMNIALEAMYRLERKGYYQKYLNNDKKIEDLIEDELLENSAEILVKEKKLIDINIIIDEDIAGDYIIASVPVRGYKKRFQLAVLSINRLEEIIENN